MNHTNYTIQLIDEFSKHFKMLTHGTNRTVEKDRIRVQENSPNEHQTVILPTTNENINC